MRKCLFYYIFQVVWGGVAGGAGAFLWFLLTQVHPFFFFFDPLISVTIAFCTAGIHPTLPMGGHLENIRVFPHQVLP